MSAAVSMPPGAAKTLTLAEQVAPTLRAPSFERPLCATCDGSRDVHGERCPDCEDGFADLYMRASKTDGLVHFWVSEDAFNGDGAERDALCGDALEGHDWIDSRRTTMHASCRGCERKAKTLTVAKGAE